MKINQPLSNEDYVRLLEEERYEEILTNCHDYIKEKVETYLRNFPYYHQFRKDFFHEVYIHMMTRSLPSPAFLQACQNGNSFRFYLAKSVKNCLNTLLSKERVKKESIIHIESIYSLQEDTFDADKSLYFESLNLKEQTDSQDILDRIKEKFDVFLKNFGDLFPKIITKLILLLKLHARFQISESDIKNCFKEIKSKDIEKLLLALGTGDNYPRKEDKEIYEIIQPYFLEYRKEKGSPSSIQRWLNQYISGDKSSQGMIDKLEIKDQDYEFRISDKKLFSDFLHIYFKSKTEELGEVQKQTETLVPAENWKIPDWATAWSR